MVMQSRVNREIVWPDPVGEKVPVLRAESHHEAVSQAMAGDAEASNNGEAVTESLQPSPRIRRRLGRAANLAEKS